ncbi:MAG: thioesterase family protein [Planctomycetaceae bacterium]|nr:thioesterase family protein [Planctomycetaceae bacterium]
MSIPTGTAHSESVVVSEANLASAVGGGLVDVYATPMLVALCELAASNCVKPHLEAGEVTVGTKVDIEHSAASVTGMRVTATATVTAVDRRRVDFSLSVVDEAGEVGKGVHSRFIVDREKFIARAAARKA